MDTQNNFQLEIKFSCQICDYHTSKKSNYKQHLLSAKHEKAENGNKVSILETNALLQSKPFTCTNCGNHYANRSGLWKHSAKCSHKDNTQLFIDIIKKNEDVKGFLMEQNKQLVEQNNKLMELLQSKTTNLTTNNVNNNNCNNSFNLNVYLTETCKDALNINEFVDSLVLNVNDLENTARIGYANGISKIFITGLKKLDVCKRPVHCSDMKRSTLYIKNENQWIKETDDKPILTKAIKQVANKNIKNIFEWQKINPDYKDPESKQNDRYNKLICETMSGSSNEEQLQNYEKVVSNVVKEVVINKYIM
jgi:hypothetical protein